ncbi:MAG TPA: ABC transporter permease [Candidatus Blautia avicola]|uniref:ABC transporter permease n=1 Tax=Candidatus Blautia avicola TaxID=2838483 RepID=A0A9D2TXW7_9FIRM|nr:ABC transporter permease [Candidatus Blautia avicola]
MNNRFFPKLAASNIKKNGKAYIPYILSCVMTVAMFYIVKSLSYNPGLKNMVGSNTMMTMMSMCSVMIALFAIIFLFYTNSFLVKRRKKEFGVFNILGMEKSHIAKTMAWENFYVTLISIAGGLVIGIALDKAMFLLIAQVLNEEISLGFFISDKAIISTVVMFCIIFLLILLNSIRQIQTANPIELLTAGNAGEREPKTKWVLTILGLLSLGTGYYIALAIKNPLTALVYFFFAVILVIIGTYMLFTAGSIALLKILRKNKKYYYKTKHFTSISGMIYRMKQNAVGLANICILSTAVLVMVSSTSSLMLGMQDVIATRYPDDFIVYSNETSEERAYESFDAIRELQEEQNLNVTSEREYRYLVFPAFISGDTFEVTRDANFSSLGNLNNLIFVSLSDYNRVMGTDKTLAEDEILVYSDRLQFDYPTLKIFDREYSVKEKIDEFIGNGLIVAVAANTQFIVLPDGTDIEELYALQKETLSDGASEIQYYYGFNSDADEETQRAFYRTLLEDYVGHGYEGTIESKVDSRSEFVGLYGGFFFIGIFLGILFIMATVLIIYYKQISEGYDDKQRYEIMQKVGMTHQEIKNSIHSQVLTVFFLPLIVAGIHIAVAFPIITKLLALLNLLNVQLFLTCTVVCYVVFAVMYLLIYLLTARTYYKIVSK